MKRVHMERLTAGILILASILLIVWTLTQLAGCATQARPDIMNGGGPPLLSGPEIETPGENQQALWIFSAAGLPFLLAGGVQMFLTGRSQLLIVGVGLGLIPTVLIWIMRTASPALYWSLIGCAAIGVIALGASVGRAMGWWEWRRKGAKAADILEAKINGAPEDQARRARRTAELVEHFGTRNFDLKKVDIP